MQFLKAAFAPMGPTVAVAIGTGAPTVAAQVPSPGVNSQNSFGVRIYNPGANDVWVGWGATQAAAIANSVIPTVGTSTLAVPIKAGTSAVLNFPVGTFFTGITTSTGSTLYLTPGLGIS